MSEAIDRKTRIWRRALISLGVFTFAVFLLHMALPWDGSLGAWEARSGDPYTLRIAVLSTGVDYAYRAGLRTGDMIDVRRLSPEKRHRLLNRKVSGEPITLPIRRNGRTLNITVVATQALNSLFVVLPTSAASGRSCSLCCSHGGVPTTPRRVC